MLSIITCIRHPETAKDFGRINELLQKTINSLHNQTNKNFELFIVCNQGSEFNLNTYDIKTNMVYVDFPPTEQIVVVDEQSQLDKWNAVRKDKGTKCLAGLNEALKNKPEFIMFVDGDDYLHKGLVEHIAQNKQDYDGFIIDKGFGYKLGSNIAYEIEPFNLSCGTCNIYRAELFYPYLEQAIFTNQQAILNSVDDFMTYKILGSHKHANELFQRAHAKFQYVPFAAAMYIIDNGENDSGINQVTFKARTLNAAIVEDFALQTKPSLFFKRYNELFRYRFKASIKKNRNSLLVRNLVSLKQKLISLDLRH